MHTHRTDRALRVWRRLRRVRPLAMLALLAALGLPTLLGAAAVGAAPIGQFEAPASLAGGPTGLQAGPQNGGFEAGLANWSTAGNVEVLQDTNFTSVPPTAVLPTEGGHYALLCNGPGSINPAELDNLDMDPGPNNDNDRSTLTQTFTLNPNEVPATLSFDWSFLTSEAPTPGNFDDFFRVNLSGPDGGLLLAGSAPTGGVSPFPDVTPLDGVQYTVSSAGATNTCLFHDGRSPFQKFTSIIDTPGTYILEFLVSDQGNNDHAIDTGLLVDNVQLTPEIDLAVTKTAAPNPAVAGLPLVYDLTVRNYGSGVARGVVLTDVLSPAVVYVSDTNVPACVQAPVGTLTCDLGDMAGGAVRTFQVKTIVKADARANGVLTLSNSAHVEAESPDRDLSNNDFTLRTVLTDRADLKVTKLGVSDKTVQANEIFSYQIFVDNLGPSYARNVTLLDDILASGQFTLMSIVTDPNRLGDACTTTPGVGTPVPGPGTPPPGTGTPSPVGSIQCTLGEPLEPQGFAPGNGRWTIEVRVRALNAQDVQNVVRVLSSDPDGTGPEDATADPDLANNMAMHFIAVTSVANLRITKIGRDLADNDLTVVAGGSVRYTITVYNDGPSVAKNVTVVDQLPGGLVDGSVEANITLSTGAGGICTVGTPGDAADPLICQVGTMPSGSSAVITILADVDPSFVVNQPQTPFANYLANDAYTYSDTFDPNTLHNRASDAFLEVVGSADLAVEKFALPTSAAAGTPVSYRLRITNHGPSTAEHPVIDDNLPVGVSFLSATVLGGVGSCVYNAGAHQVRCTLDHMPPTTVVEILLVVGVNADVPDGTVLTNQATRNAALTVTADPVAGNNSATATTNVFADSDVAVKKSVEPVKVGAGEQVKYTIDVRNHGPSDAQSVVVFDVLPDEVRYEIDTNSPMCTMPSNLVGLRAVLTGGNEVPPVSTQAMGLVTMVLNTDTNVLRFSIHPTDITGIVSAHIHFAPAGVNGPVHVNLYAGSPPLFDPTLPLVGEVQLDAAEAVDLLANPHYVNVHTTTHPGGEIRGQLTRTVNQPLRCEIGLLPAPKTDREPPDSPSRHSFVIWAKVLPETPPGTIITNVAIATSPTELRRALPAPPSSGAVYRKGGNNSAFAKNYIEGKSDLKILKFGKMDGQVRAGERLTYTVIVDNLGPGSAKDVELKDLMRSSGTFTVHNLTSDRPMTCTSNPPGIAAPPLTVTNNLEFDCALRDPLAVLDADGFPNSGRWILTLYVSADQTQDINNVVDVFSESKDPNLTNNHAAVEHEITDVADLSLDKVGPPTVVAGTPIQWTIRVVNNGPSNAENVVVYDRLPPGIVVTSVTAEGGTSGASCTTGAAGSPVDRLSCNLGTLAVGEDRRIVIDADVSPSLPAGMVLENDAFVLSDIFDDDTSNNIDYTLTTVRSVSDLSVTKRSNRDDVEDPNDDAEGPVVAGTELEYVIRVRNGGPSDAAEVLVVDTLPASAVFLSATIVEGSGTCSGLPLGKVTCQLGTLPVGKSVVIVVRVFIRPDHNCAVPQLLNVVDVSSPSDVDGATTRINTRVVCDADLGVEKWSDPVIVNAGEQKRYTVKVTNHGPTNAANVVLTDILPPEVDYVVDTGLCAVAPDSGPGGADVVTCTVPLLPVGGMFQVVIHTIVKPQTVPGSTIVNTATVTSSTPDSNQANNRAQSENYVLQKSDLKVTKFGKNDGEVRAEDILTYTVIVDNLGPSWAHRVALKDVLQTAAKFELLDIHSDRAATCSILKQGGVPAAVNLPATQWPIAAPVPPLPAVPDINQRLEVDCNLAAPLQILTADGPPNNGRWVLTMRVRARQAQDVNNIAYVTDNGIRLRLADDPAPANNMAMVQHEIVDVADLSVVKTAIGQIVTGCAQNEPTLGMAPNQVTAGLNLAYTIVVTNHGPSDAENVVLYDRLPPGVVLVPGSGTIDGSATKFTTWCSTGQPGNVADQLTCGLGYMVPTILGTGSVVTIRYQVRVDQALSPGTILENDARVWSDVFDDNNANNQAHNQTTVNTWADLELTKTHDPATAVAGELLRYTLAVTNKGPSLAKDVWIYDDLPNDVTFLSTIGGLCIEDPVTPGNLVCQVGDMRAGTTQYVYVIVRVHADAPPFIDNIAIAQSGFSDDTPNPGGGFTADAVAPTQALRRPGTPDPCPADNVATDRTPVVRKTDVFIRKSDLVDPVIAGAEARFLVTFGNRGPSTATNVSVTDLLPNGFVLDRCEPLDPNDAVTCTAVGTRNVTLQQILKANSVVWTSNVAQLANRLDPNEQFSFYIVADVSPGYVLDGLSDGRAGGKCAAYAQASDYLFWAHDTATISSKNSGDELEINVLDNSDDECTRVNSEADLEIRKTDVFGTDPNNGFLQCDPVAPGGMITYDITVTNHGLSDAAMVEVTDWLPKGVVVDPNQVVVTLSNGLLVEKRDDGRILVVVGNDPRRAAPTTAQIGRLNAGRSVTFRIQVMVPRTAECGSVLTNVATVTTVLGRNLPGQTNPWPEKNQTPTADPDRSNNRATETTTVLCPRIRVRKTVSYDGKCPGFAFTTINQTAQPVTFCYEITNTGDTYLDNIAVQDILKVRTEHEKPIFDDLITHGADPKLPVAPGETVRRQVTIEHLLKDWNCGTATNTVTVKATPVNSGRTVYPCLPAVQASDSRTIEVPCAGVDFRLQLPVVNSSPCQTWIQAQNVGNADARAMLVYWGDPGACEPQAAGPLKVECGGLLKPGSAWSFAANQVPPGARSAVVYSLNATAMIKDLDGNTRPFADVACGVLFNHIVGDWQRWQSFDIAYRLRDTWRSPFDQSGLHQVLLDFGANQGEPLAVSVNRKCPDAADPNVASNAAYTGISSDMEGARDPFSGSFTFYAPLIFAQRGGLNSMLYIQNSGIQCTSLEVWFKAQDNCLRAILGDVLSLAPGETVAFDPNAVAGPDWIGSAWIRSTQPLGIIVDTVGANHFTSYAGLPGDVSALEFTYGDQVTYAPLIYNQMQGWDTAIQVQNHSATTAAKVKVYFLDHGGGVIATVVDWICPRGSQSFFLPVIGGLPGNWVGSARVESQAWWTPGTPEVDPPTVSAIVMLEKWTDPARTARREAVAYNAQGECLLYDWQIGHGWGGLMSGSAVFAVPLLMKDYNGVTTELAITNLVPKPGFTDFAIYIYDQNGLLDYVCQKLNEKQVEYINLATWGYVNPRFNGSAVVSAVFWEHDVFDQRGVFERNLVGLGAVAVERVGGINGGPDVPGDESKAFEALPVYDHFMPMGVPKCPGIRR